jgi:hypothetical protein
MFLRSESPLHDKIITAKRFFYVIRLPHNMWSDRCLKNADDEESDLCPDPDDPYETFPGPSPLLDLADSATQWSDDDPHETTPDQTDPFQERPALRPERDPPSEHDSDQSLFDRTTDEVPLDQVDSFNCSDSPDPAFHPGPDVDPDDDWDCPEEEIDERTIAMFAAQQRDSDTTRELPNNVLILRQLIEQQPDVLWFNCLAIDIAFRDLARSLIITSAASLPVGLTQCLPQSLEPGATQTGRAIRQWCDMGKKRATALLMCIRKARNTGVISTCNMEGILGPPLNGPREATTPTIPVIYLMFHILPLRLLITSWPNTNPALSEMAILFNDMAESRPITEALGQLADPDLPDTEKTPAFVRRLLDALLDAAP